MGAGGWAAAWGLNPGWTQASQGHAAGHAGPSAGWPEACPLAPSRCIKDFGTFHPRIRHSLSQTERVFYNERVFFLTLFCVFSPWTLEDDFDAPAPAPGPAGCRGRLLPLCPVPLQPQPSSWALGGPQGVPQLAPQGPPTCSFCSHLPGALGLWLGLSPTCGLGLAKAACLVTMQKLSREAPWAARWVLTQPPQLSCLLAVTPKEQN